MLAFLDDIAKTFNSGCFSTALLSALVVPDAAGAIDQPETRQNKVRYVAWYDRWIGSVEMENATQLDGAFIWQVRNMMMHETALSFRAYGFDRVLFVAPYPGSCHMNIIADCGDPGESGLIIELAKFLKPLLAGGRAWARSVDDPARLARLDNLIQLRPYGRAPFVEGVPLIS